MSAGEGKPVLLTEAEAMTLTGMGYEAIMKTLRERGLIAEKPVDPALVEAREIVAAVNIEKHGDYYKEFAESARQGEEDDHVEVLVALAALRRGMELRPELTRERVREMVIAALVSSNAVIRYEDFDAPLGDRDRRQAEETVDALHAALTDGGRDG